MRDISASLHISCRFKRRYCRANAGFNIADGIIPTGLPSNFQCRTLNGGARFGKVFDRLPYLLYIADTQLSLIEQNKVFVKIVIVEQNAAIRL